MTRRDFITTASLATASAMLARPTRSLIGGRILEAEGNANLPYDSEVEYLQSSGTQYIDLLLNSTDDVFCDFDIKYLRLTDYGYAPFGYRYGATARYGLWINGGGLTYYAGVDSSHSADLKVPPRNYDVHHLSVRNGQYIEFDGNRTEVGIGTVRDNIGILLFAMVTSGRGKSEFIKDLAQVYYFKVYDKYGEPLRDMIPVRKDGAGYMYDFVTESLFGNSGTGEFILGTDVRRRRA